MISNDTYTKQLIIKPSSVCNFSCNFCSTRLLDIPMHDKVPQVLKDYILETKPNDLIITGGEPLANPRSYFEDLFSIMDSLGIEYEMSLTSNMVLWYENPEKYDYLINNPRVSIDTSFQYGIDRHDNTVYTDERFAKVCKAFEERYNKPLWFIYVVNEDNEQYVKKACELAKQLGIAGKFNSQFPVGAATKYYPKYKLLNILLNLVEEGIIDEDHVTVDALRRHTCPYTQSYKYCLLHRAVYVDKNEQLVIGKCEEYLNSCGKYKTCNGMLFKRCLACPMYSLCNGCSIHRQCTEEVKDEHCKWMKEHYQQLKKHGWVW